MALKHKSEVALRFSKAASRYDKFAGVQARLAQQALLQMPQCSDADIQGWTLDIGCATGVHSAKLGPKVVGLDLAIGMLEQAQATHANRVSWVNADMDNLPFTQAAFARIFSSMALQWTANSKRVMQSMFDVLQAAGTATLLIPVQGSFAQLKTAYENASMTSRLNPLITEQHWLDAAQMAGFSIQAQQVLVETDCYASITALLGSISKIGAASSVQGSSALLSRQQLKQLAASYPLNNAGQFALDYRCLLVTLEK